MKTALLHGLAACALLALPASAATMPALVPAPASATPPKLTPEEVAKLGWNAVPLILQHIKAPTFPAKDFPITQFGAEPGSDKDCTEAIAKAIAAANAAGGGRVVVPKGLFRTGAVHLKSNVNLHVEEGATLQFIPLTRLYPTVLTRFESVELMNYSPFIYALDQENIGITGKGILDGSSTNQTWWSLRGSKTALNNMGETGVPVAERVFGFERDSGLRPNFIQPYRCKNVLIEGVTIINSPMWEINPVLCTNVIVRGVNISSHGPNNDGCDPESCSYVLIEDCIFDTGDDCIAIKSGRNNDGRRVNVPSEFIIVRNCVMKDGHGGVVLGSECTGGIRNVFVDNCRMDSPDLDRALRFKNNAQRGGVLENVFMRNCTIGQVAEAVVTIDLRYQEGANGPHTAIVRNVYVDNCTSLNSPRVTHITQIPTGIIQNINIANSTFRGVTITEPPIEGVTVTLKNVTIERERGTPPAAPAATPAPAAPAASTPPASTP